MKFLIVTNLSSQVGWCGVSNQKGQVVSTNPDLGNWVIIDLRAPTIVRGFRTQGVQRLDNRLKQPALRSSAHTRAEFVCIKVKL